MVCDRFRHAKKLKLVFAVKFIVAHLLVTNHWISGFMHLPVSFTYPSFGAKK